MGYFIPAGWNREMALFKHTWCEQDSQLSHSLLLCFGLLSFSKIKINLLAFSAGSCVESGVLRALHILLATQQPVELELQGRASLAAHRRRIAR